MQRSSYSGHFLRAAIASILMLLLAVIFGISRGLSGIFFVLFIFATIAFGLFSILFVVLYIVSKRES